VFFTSFSSRRRASFILLFTLLRSTAFFASFVEVTTVNFGGFASLPSVGWILR